MIDIVDEMKEVRCYEAKTEEIEKASSYWELNSGHFQLESLVLCY